MHHFNLRKAVVTTLPCPECGKPLTAERSCFSARMHCESCGTLFPIEDFVAKADNILEEFLDGLYVDRI